MCTYYQAMKFAKKSSGIYYLNGIVCLPTLSDTSEPFFSFKQQKIQLNMNIKKNISENTILSSGYFSELLRI